MWGLDDVMIYQAHVSRVVSLFNAAPCIFLYGVRVLAISV